ncbi:uncharacterized protein LOC131254038, partial [Magnolia sinica]|uniref:uncharacterized protein LOC131254038 n=1 Tax=Magnolia sinica TaxID=86752 RepID=UPI00265B3789
LVFCVTHELRCFINLLSHTFIHLQIETNDSRCEGKKKRCLDHLQQAENYFSLSQLQQGIWVFKKTEKQSACEEPKFPNLYVKNLENGLTDDSLWEKFSVFGKIISAIVMKDDYGKSRGFGFVSFELSKDAKKAMWAMNGAQLGSKNLHAGRAQKKAEREQMLSCLFKGLNVYVKKPC